MRKIDIQVDHNTTTYIERLQYEVQGYERIIKTMITDPYYGDIETNENFKKYHKRYENTLAEYEMAKQEMSSKYIPSTLNQHKTNWSLDFEDSILHVTISCDCLDELSNEELIKLINDNTEEEDDTLLIPLMSEEVNETVDEDGEN